MSKRNIVKKKVLSPKRMRSGKIRQVLRSVSEGPIDLDTFEEEPIDLVSDVATVSASSVGASQAAMIDVEAGDDDSVIEIVDPCDEVNSGGGSGSADRGGDVIDLTEPSPSGSNRHPRSVQGPREPVRLGGRLGTMLESGPSSGPSTPLAPARPTEVVDLTDSPGPLHGPLPKSLKLPLVDTQSVKAESGGGSPGGGLQCPVCLDPLTGLAGSNRQPYSTLCGHLFCSECLAAALARNNVCPVCRKHIGRNDTIRLFV